MRCTYPHCLPKESCSTATCGSCMAPQRRPCCLTNAGQLILFQCRTVLTIWKEILVDMSDFQYMGSELEIFAHASHWKSYVQSKLRSYLVGDVLEVGAGIGGTTQALNDGTQRRWVCLEPDSGFAKKIGSLPHLRNREVLVGMLPDINPQEKFDAILYIDVLEHIK